MHLNFQNTRFYSVCAVLVTNDWTEIRFEIKDDHGSEHLKKFNKKFAPHFIYSFILYKLNSQVKLCEWLCETKWSGMNWIQIPKFTTATHLILTFPLCSAPLHHTQIHTHTVHICHRALCVDVCETECQHEGINTVYTIRNQQQRKNPI